MALTVRRVHAGESRALTELAARTFTDTYAPFCRRADVETYVSTYLTDVAVRAVLNDAAARAFVAEDDGAWLGYAVIRPAHLPLHVPPVHVAHPTELVRFYVRHDWHGRGVAAALFAEVVRDSERDTSDALWLQTWQENARAIAYYQKNGFRIVGTSTFQMGDEVQDDFLMLRTPASHAAR